MIHNWLIYLHKFAFFHGISKGYSEVVYTETIRLFLLFLWEGEGVPKEGDYFSGFALVGKVEDIALLSALVSASGFRVSHKRRDAIKFFNESVVIACGDNALFIYVYNVVAHHLAGADFSERSKDFTNEVYKFRCTSHSANLRIICEISKEYFING